MRGRILPNPGRAEMVRDSADESKRNVVKNSGNP
jgi:hypothetical protein